MLATRLNSAALSSPIELLSAEGIDLRVIKVCYTASPPFVLFKMSRALTTCTVDTRDCRLSQRTSADRVGQGFPIDNALTYVNHT